MWGRSWSTRQLTCWPATGRTVPAPLLPASWSCLIPWRCSQSTWTASWKLLPWLAAQSSQQTTVPSKGFPSWAWGWRTHSCCSTHASSHCTTWTWAARPCLLRCDVLRNVWQTLACSCWRTATPCSCGWAKRAHQTSSRTSLTCPPSHTCKDTWVPCRNWTTRCQRGSDPSSAVCWKRGPTPWSSLSWGRKTSQRCCSVSSWWRIKACTVALPTWTSFATFTERSGSYSPNPSPLLIPALGLSVLSLTGLENNLSSDGHAQISHGQSHLAPFELVRRVQREERLKTEQETSDQESLLRFYLESPKLPFQHTLTQYDLQITTCHLRNFRVKWTTSISCTDACMWWTVEMGMTADPEAWMHFGIKQYNMYLHCAANQWKCFYSTLQIWCQDKGLFVDNTVDVHFETQ